MKTRSKKPIKTTSKPRPTMLSRIKTLTSELLERAQLAARAGMTFGGDRDLYQVLGYDRVLTVKKYRERFKRNGIAARVVDALPKATWRGGVELAEDEDPEVITPFEEAWNDLAERLKIWSVLQRADVLAGLGRYSIILVGVPGDMSTPIPDMFPPEAIAYLAPYAEDEAQILEWDQDATSERFGQPNMYQVTRRTVNTGLVGRSSVSFKVHYSRVIHIADGSLDDAVFGQPRLERVWNFLDDMDKVSGGGAEAFWLRANQGMVVDVDKELSLGDSADEREAAIDSLQDAAEELSHKMRRAMVTRGTTVSMLGSDVADYSKPLDSCLTLISGSTGIPKRILMGSERGELASTQDRENWNERVVDRRKDFAEPYILRPLADMFIEHGALPEPESYDVFWPEISVLNDEQRANVAAKWAGLNSKETVVTRNEIRDHVLLLPPIEEVMSPEELEAEQLAKDSAAMMHQSIVDGTADIDPQEEDDAPQKKKPSPFAPKAAARNLKSMDRTAKLVNRFRGRLARELEKAVAFARESMPEVELIRVVAAFDKNGLERILNDAFNQMSAKFKPRVRDAMLTALNASGASEARAVRNKGRFRGAKDSTATFKGGSPRAMTWADVRATELISGIDRDARRSIREIVARTFNEQKSATSAAREIKQVIGLTSAQESAVDKLRARLEDASGQTISVFGGNLNFKVPEAGWSDAQIDRATARYAEKLLDHRAKGIADTQLSAAVNEGKREMWLQAQEEGKLSVSAQRQWDAQSDCCDECDEMDGQQVGLDEDFEGPDGDAVDTPIHTNCRCSQSIVEVG